MLSDFLSLKKEADFLLKGKISYDGLLNSVQNDEKSASVEFNESDIDMEIIELRKRLELSKQNLNQAKERRKRVSYQLHPARLLRDAITIKKNQLTYELNTVHDHLDSMKEETNRISVKLQKYMQINVINDAFYIWYTGSFGTINNFRLGNLTTKPVEWVEINAALGQVVLGIHIVAVKAGYDFKKYILHPMGSFSKIYKAEDPQRRAPMALYIDVSFSLFPTWKRSFNSALTGFLTCVQELGDFIKGQDPTLALPYAINAAELRVFDQSCALVSGDEESWTRSLKFLLTDVKWIIAWCTKHCGSGRPTVPTHLKAPKD